MKQLSNRITESSSRICYPSRIIKFQFPARQEFCSSTPHSYMTWDLHSPGQFRWATERDLHSPGPFGWATERDLHSPGPFGWATERDLHSPGPFGWATERDLHSPGPFGWTTERDLHSPGPFGWTTESHFPGSTRLRRFSKFRGLMSKYLQSY